MNIEYLTIEENSPLEVINATKYGTIDYLYINESALSPIDIHAKQINNVTIEINFNSNFGYSVYGTKSLTLTSLCNDNRTLKPLKNYYNLEELWINTDCYGLFADIPTLNKVKKLTLVINETKFTDREVIAVAENWVEKCPLLSEFNLYYPQPPFHNEEEVIKLLKEKYKKITFKYK